MPVSPEERESYITERREYLEENRMKYKEAIEQLKSPEAFKRFLIHDLPPAIALIEAYDPTKHTSDFAVAACAVTKANMTNLLQVVRFIGHYEECEEQLAELVRQQQLATRSPSEGEQDG